MRARHLRTHHRRGLATVLLVLGCGPDLVMTSGTTSSTGTTSTSGGTDSSAGPGSSTPGDGTTTSGADDTGGSSSSGSGGLGPGSDCNILTQECAEGLKCTVNMQSGGPRWICVPAVDDPVGVGETCTVEESGSGLDDCEVGAVCFGVDPRTLEGTCLDYCVEGPTNNPTCEDPDTFCLIPGDASYGMWCLEVCDPRQSSCAEGLTCVPTGGGWGAFTCGVDVSGDQGAAGDPCEFIGQCDPGLVCIEAAQVPGCMGAFGCCSSFCDVGDDGPCQPGQQCTPWFEGELPHPIHEGLGVCAAP